MRPESETRAPLIRAGGRTAACRLVVFDKDGTLIDFNRIWWGRLERGITALCRQIGAAGALEDALYRTLGGDRATRTVLPEAPYAIAANAKICTVAATVVHQAGHAWPHAEALVAATLGAAMRAAPEPSELVPLADLPALLRRLRHAGIRTAIATSDDRLGTEATMRLLGLEGLIDHVTCADDGPPLKPDPALMTSIAARLGVPPPASAIVSDSASDLAMGRAAGAGFMIGVLSGAARHDDIAGEADVVIGSVGEIEVIPADR